MILLDGPMGTELAARGVATPSEGWSAHALDTAPDVVRAIHADYARAGATVHRTNTFRTQERLFPETWRALVAKAVRLAREGVREGAPADVPAVRIAGSIAPVFDCYRPDLAPPEDVARRSHRALARALADEGVDLLVCETFPNAAEARVAVEEAAATGLETWVSFTAGPDGTAMTPDAMALAAREAVRAGATAVHVNCVAARLTLPYVERLAGVGVSFGAYANVGDASGGLGAGDEAMPPLSDEACAAYVAHAEIWIRAGATTIGACCGTGPRVIQVVNSALTRSSPTRDR